MKRAWTWKRQPTLEVVEQRLLLATFVVKSTADSASATAGDGTLRGEILQLNKTGTASGNTISFTLPTGAQTIAVSSALPTITVPVTIDGTTQAGYSGAPLITLSGASAGSNADGLDIAAGNSTVRGLVINGFSGEGIALSVAGGDTITGNYIGTNAAGTAAVANALDGIVVLVNSNNNVITNNLISGNTVNGVYLNGEKFGATNPATSGNTVAGNKIGVDLTGATALGNGGDGIYVQNAPNSIIGGTGGAATRNIISGNKNGLELYDNSDGSVIEGNYIGTNSAGSAAIGNSPQGVVVGSGIILRGISNSTIGGTAPGAGNLISANLNYGIDSFVIGSANLLIQGNLIGTDATGTKALGNNRAGVYIAGPSNVTIGGTAAGAGNVISGNTDDGITTFGNAQGLLIEGNKIGTAIDGTTALGNGGDGINAAVNNVTIGGTAAGAGNIIANNGATATFDHSGVVIASGAAPVAILGNSIYNNKLDGIEDQHGSTPNQVAPVLTSAVSMGNTSTVAGSLTTANGTYLLQFFSTPTLNASGNAEGKTLIGSTTITVTSATQTFNAALTSGFDPGSLITATATSLVSGTPTNTSAFSKSVGGTGTGPNNKPPVLTVSAPSTVLVGGNLTEVFTITNNSTATDSGVAFVDSIPTGTTFVSGTSSLGVAVAASNGVISSAIGTLLPNASVTVTVVLTVEPTAVPSVTNTASVTATTPTLTTGQDTVSATTTVTPLDDVSVAVVGPSGPTAAGSTVVYTVTVANSGPSTATNINLADTLPIGVALVSAQSSDGTAVRVTSGGVAETIATLAGGGSVTLLITVATSGSTPGSITDSATATGAVADSNTGNNSASATTTLVPAADLVVSNGPPPATVLAGTTATLTASVGNNGPSTATDVVLTFNLPAGVTFVSGTAPGGAVTVSNGVVFAPVGNLTSGGTGAVSIVVLATTDGSPSVADSVASDQADTNPGNNAGTIALTVLPSSDLAVQLSGPITPPTLDGTLVYTAVVTNNGPSAAPDVVVTNSLFAGATFLSASINGVAGGTASNGTITLPVGLLAAGQSASLIVSVRPSQTGTFALNASVTGDPFDANLANNSASLTVTVSPQSDLSVYYSDKPGTATVGQPLTYTAVVTNNGPSADTGVTVTTAVIDGSAFLSSTVNGVLTGSVSNGTVTLPVGALAVGQSATITITMLPLQVGAFNAAISVAGDQPDGSPINNAASAIVVVNNPVTTVAPVSIIEFSAGAYTVDKAAGTATIAIKRVGDLTQAISATFSTSGGTAVVGRDYTPVTQVVAFAPGVNIATVTIPILDLPSNNVSSTVTLTLANATNATFDNNAPTATAQLRITDTAPVLFGPTINEVKLSGPATGITAVELDFNEALDPTTASNPANYTLTALASGAVVTVVGVAYNPETNAVLLVPSSPLPVNQFFLLDVNGTRTGAVTDLAGNPLYSVVTSAASASDYRLAIARGTNLQFTDQNGAVIHLKLAGPGVVDVDQTAGGLVGRVQILGTTSKSTLSGSATRSTDLGVVGLLGRFKKSLTNLPRPYRSVGTLTFTEPIKPIRIAPVDTLTVTPPTKKGKVKATAVPTSTTPHPRGATLAGRHPQR